MEPENLNQEVSQVEQPSSLHQVTPLSKYLAMALFILMPFVGGYIGYVYAPDKVVEKEVVVNSDDEVTRPIIAPSRVSYETYTSPNGFSIVIPKGVEVVEEPAQFSYSAITNFTGDFGSMCISPSYGCGGKGVESAQIDTTILSSLDGTEMNIALLRGGNNSVTLIIRSLKPIPSGFTDSAQIQVFTTEENLSIAQSILASIKFVERSTEVQPVLSGATETNLTPEGYSPNNTGWMIEGGDVTVYEGDRVIIAVANVTFGMANSERVVVSVNGDTDVLDAVLAGLENQGRVADYVDRNRIEVEYTSGVYSGGDIIMLQ